jgi:hypothetical protein
MSVFWDGRTTRVARIAVPGKLRTVRSGLGVRLRQSGECDAPFFGPDLELDDAVRQLKVGPSYAGINRDRSDIDLDAATVDVRWRLVRRTGVGLLRLPSTKTGRRGERLIPLPSLAMTMLKRRRLAIGPGGGGGLPDSLGGWRDPSNVRRIWRQVRETLELDGLVTHTLRKTMATFLDDADVSTRRISDQLGHAKVSMTQDRHLGRRLTDRQTADVLEALFEVPGDETSPKTVP